MDILVPAYGRMTELFGEDSYVIQPPDHIALYTPESFSIMAEKSGLKLESIKRRCVYNWYLKSYMLKNKIEFSEYENKDALQARLSEEQIASLKKIWNDAKKNERRDGDQFHIILKKQGSCLVKS